MGIVGGTWVCEIRNLARAPHAILFNCINVSFEIAVWYVKILNKKIEI